MYVHLNTYLYMYYYYKHVDILHNCKILYIIVGNYL